VGMGTYRKGNQFDCGQIDQQFHIELALGWENVLPKGQTNMDEMTKKNLSGSLNPMMA
jgi:hypothetical protein